MVGHGIHRKIGFEGVIEGAEHERLENISTIDYESISIDDSDFGAAFLEEQQHEGQHHRSPAKSLLILLLMLHILGIFVWLRIWLRDRKIKAARLGKNTPPPQRQSCTYDVDSRLISKIELPLKALKLAKA